MSTVRERRLSQDEILVRDKGADKLEIANIFEHASPEPTSPRL